MLKDKISDKINQFSRKAIAVINEVNGDLITHGCAAQ